MGVLTLEKKEKTLAKYPWKASLIRTQETGIVKNELCERTTLCNYNKILSITLDFYAHSFRGGNPKTFCQILEFILPESKKKNWFKQIIKNLSNNNLIDLWNILNTKLMRISEFFPSYSKLLYNPCIERFLEIGLRVYCDNLLMNVLKLNIVQISVKHLKKSWKIFPLCKTLQVSSILWLIF